MKSTSEELTAVKDALVAILDDRKEETAPPVELGRLEWEESLKRFLSDEPQDLSLEEFVERLCSHLS